MKYRLVILTVSLLVPGLATVSLQEAAARPLGKKVCKALLAEHKRLVGEGVLRSMARGMSCNCRWSAVSSWITCWWRQAL